MSNPLDTNDDDSGLTTTAFIDNESVSAWNDRFQKLRRDALVGGADCPATRFLFRLVLGVSDLDDNDHASLSYPQDHTPTQKLSSPSCIASTSQPARSSSPSHSGTVDHSSIDANHGSQQTLPQAPIPDPTVFQQDTFSTKVGIMSFADRPPANANRAQKRSASTAAEQPLSPDTAGSSLAKKHRTSHDQTYHSTEELGTDTAAASKLSLPTPAKTANKNTSTKKYCILHGHSRHSTDECRAAQTIDLSLQSSQSPSPSRSLPTNAPENGVSDKKQCAIHGFGSHSTKECRTRQQFLQLKSQNVKTGSTTKPPSHGKGKGKSKPCSRCGKASGKGHKCGGQSAAAHSRSAKKGKSGKNVRAGSLPAATKPGTIKSSSAGLQPGADPSLSSSYSPSPSSSKQPKKRAEDA
ncbi:hypothetical protein BX666DRAFT_1878511 [Dichotomocladium elegans]|nr:hypothetical protein BX666DRAFT_1878511 [Dichotomocladium elegans]